MPRKANGTFEATGQSSIVSGVGVAYTMTFAGTATVVLQYYDDVAAAWVTSRSHTATTTNNPNVISDVVRRQWRLNCTAHTDDVDYDLRAGHG